MMVAKRWILGKSVIEQEFSSHSLIYTLLLAKLRPDTRGTPKSILGLVF